MLYNIIVSVLAWHHIQLFSVLAEIQAGKVIIRSKESPPLEDIGTTTIGMLIVYFPKS